MSKYLHREDAPFSDGVWEKIDQTVVNVASAQLAGRRLLTVDGPYGIALKTIPRADETVSEDDDLTVRAAPVLPVALLETSFTLAVRDIASHDQTHLPIDLRPVAQAAFKAAQKEDELIFNGLKGVEASGLMNARGVHKLELGDWQNAGEAMDDLIRAVGTLDDAGFHGPYTLALAAPLYNKLFRRYQQGNQTEIEHVRQLVSDGVVKAPCLSAGGVLLASGRQVASVVLGQDLTAGFVGPDGPAYEFNLSESVALRLAMPEGVCVLK